jgi:uncharacterized membrane protein
MFTLSHIHPMLVHFPIAITAVGFLFEFLYLFFKNEVWLTKGGYLLLMLGTLSALVTWLSGILFTANMEGMAGTIREQHEIWATITLFLLLATSFIRTYIKVKHKEENRALKNLAFIIYGISMISVFITGNFGGTLVYNYMMPL